MAKKKANKNRSARERARWKRELARREERKAAETDQELRLIIGCLAVASIMLAVIVTIA